MTLTLDYLKNEIEFKKKCIYYTIRVIKDPPIDELSRTMIEQNKRLELELIVLVQELAKLEKSAKSKKTKKQPIKRRRK